MIATRLSTDDEARIRAAAEDARTRTNARFTLVIVPASDRYTLFPLVYGAFLALFAGALLAIFWPNGGLRLGFGVMVAAFLLASLLLDWWPLRVALVPKHIKYAHARDLAHREFAARVLANRKQESGMVFFVSLSERYVEILADRNLHERVGEEAWRRIVAGFVSAAKTGKLAEGFLAGITASAALLEEQRLSA